MKILLGYERLEYIQGGGTQYINTGFMPNQDTRVVCDFEFTGSENLPTMFGAWKNSITDGMIFLATSAKDSVVYYYGNQELTANAGLMGRHVIDANKAELSLDGVPLITATEEAFSTDYNLLLFAYNAKGTASNKTAAKLYSCQIYDNGTLVRDFVPCVSRSGEAGLFDLVGCRFYGDRSGTGFAAGPVVEQAQQLSARDILDCPYSGAPVEIRLPPGRYKLECWGAQGGTANTTYAFGGAGGYSWGVLTLREFLAVFLYVGQQGQKGPDVTAFNGGGAGRMSSSGTGTVTSGGGATDIRLGVDALLARVMVAGAGGGSGYYSTSQNADGGIGGGVTGGDGEPYSTYTRNGLGATQTEGGKNANGIEENAGTFGQGGSNNSESTGSGGGGGWYGGGASDGYYCGGAGGSGFVWVGENAPEGYLLTEEHHLMIAATASGDTVFYAPDGTEETGHTGDGYARISVISVAPGLPEEFRQTGRGLETVSLAWDAAAGAEGYRLYRDGVQIADTIDTAFTDTAAEPYTVHNYTLAAYNASGDSEPVHLLSGAVPDAYVLDLVTDRTSSDVAAGTRKGSYCAADLNRVGAAMVYIADRLNAAGYSVQVSPKLEWADEAWVDPEAAAHYLADVAELKRQFALLSTTPALPPDLEAFSYAEANNIEKILEDIDRLLSNIFAGRMWYSGDLYSGEV